MSSYTVLGVDLVNGLIDVAMDSWAAHVQYRKELKKSDETYRRTCLQIEQNRKNEEEQAETLYRQSLAALEKKYREAPLRERTERLDNARQRMRTVQDTCSRIAKECRRIGLSRLADIAFLQEDPEFYAHIAESKESIRDTALRLAVEASLVQDDEIESRAPDFEQTAAQLRDQLAGLFVLLRSRAESEQDLAAQEFLFMQLADQLTDDTEMLGRIRTLSADTAGEAKDAFETAYALEAARRYICGPDAWYLGEQKLRELKRLYGVADVPGAAVLEVLAAADPERTAQRNMQYRASKKRDTERTVLENRRELECLLDRYNRMYLSTHGSMEGALAADRSVDIFDLLEQLRTSIRSMAKKYARQIRHEAVQATLERALIASRRGMRVKRIAASRTNSGNFRALYQIGTDGTALEVYTDAAGQVLIEAGAIAAGPEAPTERQEERIRSNNEYFCEHALPAILDSFARELAEKDGSFTVRRQKQPDEDVVHLFRLEEYDETDAAAFVVAADGTVRELDRKETEQQPSAMHVDPDAS